ncbi:MAG TPA: M28 family peptidase, partial [Phycisphaerales bacterium]|nr:M28 family peptidase [Phycisphaerales bacterium]
MHHSITPAECIATVQQLASFGTRHTLSTTTDPSRGIGAASNWLANTLRSFGGDLHVSLDEHPAPITPRTPAGGTLVNVVATLPGVMTQATHRVYCIAHYDSINADVMNVTDDAPGANDNASGCAVVLACAKALAHTRPDASIIFMLTSGEEQGLLGARAHAHKLAATTGVSQVYVLNNDTVGDPGPALLREGLPPIDTSRPLIRMFSEGLPKNMTLETAASLRTLGGEHDSPSRQLARAISDTALNDNAIAKPWSIHRPDRFLRGGDHTPFNECRFAAVRFTSLAEDYSRQHVHPHMR